MASSAISDAALSVGNKVGRYFGLTSMLPALLLILWVYALANSGPIAGPIDADRLGSAFSDWSAAKVGWLVLATLVTALLLHPLQFATTQLLEGYWGPGRIGLWAATLRSRRHRRRLTVLSEREEAYDDALNEFTERQLQIRESDSEMNIETREVELSSSAGEAVFGHVIAHAAVVRAKGVYPVDEHRVMPTRLGNALRRPEDLAGHQYGLQAILIAPHLGLASSPTHIGYIDDSRQAMDLSIRLCSLALLATVLTVVRLLTEGWWLLIATLPYLFAYVSYLGAVEAAREYGSAVATVLDLNRFTLYKALNLRLPRDTTDERRINANLSRLLQGDATAVVDYVSAAEPRQRVAVHRS